MKGRPTELTAELQRRLCELLESAVPISVACDAAGISSSTYHGWRAKGRTGEQPYADFLEETSHARSKAKVKLIKIVELAAPTDWRAAIALLQRMIPAAEWSEEEPPPTPPEWRPLPDDEFRELIAKWKAEERKNDAAYDANLAQVIVKMERENPAPRKGDA